MIEIRHKGGRFMIDETKIMYLAFQCTEDTLDIYSLYRVTAISESGTTFNLFRSNDECMARNVYDFLRAKINYDSENPFVLPMACEDYNLGVSR